MIPEYLAILVGIIMWLLGFMFAGMMYAKTPFWDGVRSVFGFWTKRYDYHLPPRRHDQN